MTDLEDALRTTLRTHERDIDASTIQRDYAVIASRRTRTRRFLPAVVAGAVVVIVGLVAYVAWPLGGTATDQPAGNPTAQNVVPPPVSGPFQVWLSEPVIPADGADVVAILTGPAEPSGEGGQTFGVAAHVDRWDGGQWQLQRDVELGGWGNVGELLPPDDQREYIDIGFGLDANGYGPTKVIHVEGLDPGWYRLRQTSNDGIEANGVFRVDGGDVAAVPVGSGDRDRLLAQPALVSTVGGNLSLSRDTALGDVVDLEMWDGTSWQLATTIDVDRDAYGLTGASIPPLPAGAYRIVDRSQPAEAQANIWVTDDTSATPLPVGPQ